MTFPDALPMLLPQAETVTVASICIATVFGLLIGSFLNVAIYRLPLRLSVLSPHRSFCPACETQLTWWENIPVLSWLLLRGKCGHCGAKISGRYPLVELLSAFAAAVAALQYGITPTGIVVYSLSAALIVIIFTDLDHRMIPLAVTYPGIITGMSLGIYSQYSGVFNFPVTQSAWDTLLGFLFGGGFLYSIERIYFWITGRIGLGGGDVRLLCMTGAILGVGSVAPTIFLGSLIGAVIGIGMMVFTGGGRHTEIPFGPWLAAGVFAYMYLDTSRFQLFY